MTLHFATNKRIHPTRLILDYMGWIAFFSSEYGRDTVNPEFLNKGLMIYHQLIDQKVALNQATYRGDRLEHGQAEDSNNLAFYGVQWKSAPLSELGTPRHKHQRLLNSLQDLYLTPHIH